jgi:hypothetical protein
MDQVHLFLQYVRRLLDSDMSLCPCSDPREAGAMLGWLTGVAASFEVEQSAALAATDTAHSAHRAAFADGLRAQLRGSAQPAGNGNGNEGDDNGE